MHHITPVCEQKPIQLVFTFLFSHTQLPNFPFLFCLPGQAGTNVSHILVLQRITQISSPHSRRTGIFLLYLHLGKTGSFLPWMETTWDRTAAQHHAWRTQKSTFQKLEAAMETTVAIKLLGEFFSPLKTDFGIRWYLIRFPSRFFKMKKFNTEFGLWLAVAEANICEGTRHPSPNTTAPFSC